MAAAFNTLSSPFLSHVADLKLYWCHAKVSHGSFVSENWLAYARISKWIHQVLDKLGSEAEDTRYTDPDFLQSDTEKELASSPENQCIKKDSPRNLVEGIFDAITSLQDIPPIIEDLFFEANLRRQAISKCTGWWAEASTDQADAHSYNKIAALILSGLKVYDPSLGGSMPQLRPSMQNLAPQLCLISLRPNALSKLTKGCLAFGNLRSCLTQHWMWLAASKFFAHPWTGLAIIPPIVEEFEQLERESKIAKAQSKSKKRPASTPENPKGAKAHKPRPSPSVQNEVGLVEAIQSKHPGSHQATYQRNLSGYPIDGIFATPDVPILAAGYYPFDKHVASDHRGLWIDFDLNSLLGGHQPTKSTHAPRRLVMHNKRVDQRYVQLAEQGYMRCNIPGRLSTLGFDVARQQGVITKSQAVRFDRIHADAYTVRRLAEQNCRKLSMGGVEWSPTGQSIRDRITLWRLLLRANVSARDAKMGLTSKRRKAHVTTRTQSIAKVRYKTASQRERYHRLRSMKQREETCRRRKARSSGLSGGLRAIQVELEDSYGNCRLWMHARK
ncbi:unnamed protein product [Cylindrotheca closterium]|uniref:Uncharacterized protein n=1 Tax=Cylindrotheca closterium TaxID=2856 RepID=A0AAD2JI27_9STRA|nr:unnamed protein product [Cylindrotheca closterium]